MNFKEITLGNGEQSVIDVDAPPKLIRRGALSIKNAKGEKDPIYIVELAEETGDVDIVRVYKAKKGMHPPMKDFEVVEKEPKFAGETKLGEMANLLLKKQSPKKKRTYVDNPPLFIAPIQYSEDTFTGKYGKGFYERTKDQFVNRDGKPAIAYGKNTGVFIGLDSIHWDKAYVDASSIVQDFVSDKELWFNLGSSTSEGPFQL